MLTLFVFSDRQFATSADLERVYFGLGVRYALACR